MFEMVSKIQNECKLLTDCWLVLLPPASLLPVRSFWLCSVIVSVCGLLSCGNMVIIFVRYASCYTLSIRCSKKVQTTAEHT